MQLVIGRESVHKIGMHYLILRVVRSMLPLLSCSEQLPYKEDQKDMQKALMKHCKVESFAEVFVDPPPVEEGQNVDVLKNKLAFLKRLRSLQQVKEEEPFLEKQAMTHARGAYVDDSPSSTKEELMPWSEESQEPIQEEEPEEEGNPVATKRYALVVAGRNKNKRRKVRNPKEEKEETEDEEKYEDFEGQGEEASPEEHVEDPGEEDRSSERQGSPWSWLMLLMRLGRKAPFPEKLEFLLA
jgi:hypothetical protein